MKSYAIAYTAIGNNPDNMVIHATNITDAIKQFCDMKHGTMAKYGGGYQYTEYAINGITLIHEWEV